MKGEWPQTELGALCSKIGSGATPRSGDKVYLAKGDVATTLSTFLFATHGAQDAGRNDHPRHDKFNKERQI